MKTKLFRLIISDVLSSEKPWNNIKKWRKSFGIKAKAIAKYIGVSPSVISDYESGRRKSPGAKLLKKIISAIVDLSGVKDNENVQREQKHVIFDDFAKELNGTIVVRPENNESSGIIRVSKDNISSINNCEEACVVSEIDGIVFILTMMGCIPNFFAVKSISDYEKKIARKFGIGVIVF